MKKIFIVVITILTIVTTSQVVEAQVKIPPVSSAQAVTQSLGISNITLKYSRPNMNDRTIFGELVPYDEVWRTGANTVSTIIFESEATIAGNKVTPGTYGILTIPRKDKWTVIFSKNSEQWGAYTYKQEEDLFRFDVKPEKTVKPVETFTMAFSDVTTNSARLNISWENTSVGFDITVDQDAEIMASIQEAMKGDNKPYFQAAQYYFKTNKDLKQALEWVNAAEQANPKAPYVKYWKAQMQLKAGDKKGAIETAQSGIELAKAGNNAEYIKLNGQVIEQAKK